MTKTIRLGVNRGKPRLWLEGQWLASVGFTRHTRYTMTWVTSTRLELVLDANGARKVSGKTKKDGSDHPIIDMNGADIGRLGFDDLTLTAESGQIAIERS